MASAQVLPSSRKQEHLEAGKRRLEEFRKKKAAERAKKTVVANQSVGSDVRVDQTQEVEGVRVTHSDGAGTSDGPVIDGVISSDNHMNSSSSKDASLLDTVYTHMDNHKFESPSDSEFNKKIDNTVDVKYGTKIDEMDNGPKSYLGSQSRGSAGNLSDHFVASHLQRNAAFDSGSRQLTSLESIENNRFLKDSAFALPYDSGFQWQAKNRSAGLLASDVGFVQPNNHLRGSSLDVDQDVHKGVHYNGSISSDFGESNFSSADGFSSRNGKATHTSESSVFDSVVRSSQNHTELSSGTPEPNSRRSRPSFLDSLNVTRAPNSIQPTEIRRESFMSNSLKSNGMDGLGSSTLQNSSVQTQTVGQQQHPMPFSVSSSNGVDSKLSDSNSWERNHELYSSKQNEDFAALEQHIEDLTQEKFSLQRALEASRALAESLAAENASLTDNYNQQRGAVNQLKSDMEKLQEEIKVHLVELESVRMEYGNAKLECNAADERAKILASEVIGLEEKALRLRSNELKLERQLENSNAEIASYKKKMSSLERERQDLQLTIDALNEEKKILQSKLRKASASRNSVDINQIPDNKKDMSTSTEDLEDTPGPSGQETVDTASPINEKSNVGVPTVFIPSDQMRMIENINTLISELTLEKEELIQALASESSQCSRLKDLNNELSHKLEAQTQRLELLTAQSMTNVSIQTRLPDSRSIQETTTYADEGDEVVERVLGWIMKLFPGGPSRRRTSKLL